MDKNANRTWKVRKAVAYIQDKPGVYTFTSFTQADQCVSCATYIKLDDAGCYSPGPQVS